MSNILLILDEQASFFRILERELGVGFDEILHASTVAAAEELLASHPVTHLVLPHDLGADGSSFSLIPRWRREHPLIERVVVFTNRAALGEEIPLDVDAIQLEPLSPSVLLATLKRKAGS